MDDIQSLDGPPKDRVLVIQPFSYFCSNKKLRAVGIWPSICHADGVWLVMFECGEFVLEFLAPDTLASSPVAKRIAALVAVSAPSRLVIEPANYTCIMNFRITRWKMVLL